MSEYRLQYRGTLFPIRSGEVILGRSSYASIVVNNPLASREHAVVRAAGGRLEVSDLGSRNGTYVNGKRVEGKQSVDVGDVIKIGTDALEVTRISEQDPQQLRVATEPGRSPSHELDGDTTVNLGRSLELAETLVNGSPIERRPAIASEAFDIVSELLADATLDPADRQRISTLLETISGWGLSPEHEERRNAIVARVAAGSTAPR